MTPCFVEPLPAPIHRPCRACGAILPLNADHFRPRPDGPWFRGVCRACERAFLRSAAARYRQANGAALRRAEWQRRRRDRYIPNRRLRRVITQAKAAYLRRETQVGYYALLRRIFAVPADQALP